MHQRTEAERTRLGSVLSDPQFWIPVLVLIGGLGVLSWMR